MRVAVITDIHANIQALEAGLADIDACEGGIDEIWCLGDVIGYGADPDPCVALVAERCRVCLAGNHDLAVLGELDISSFSPAAAAAVRWTQNNIDDDSLRYLRKLEPSHETDDVALYHASPRDPIWEYVLWPDQAADCLVRQGRRVSCVGHSHVPLHFHLLANGDVGTTAEGDRPPMAVRSDVSDSDSIDISGGRWLLNPGSLGQPRDGDRRGAWLELDTETWQAAWHRVEYDIEAAAAAIGEAGLPHQLAKRLFNGK